MKIISFGFTLSALLAGHKTVTRRDWKDSHALSFKAGELVQAWDRSPRVGGHRVATIRLTKKPYREQAADMPFIDYWREGLAYMQSLGDQGAAEIWSRWHLENPILWVVRFAVVDIEGA